MSDKTKTSAPSNTPSQKAHTPPTAPYNPLIDQHPVDTLIHVQATLTFIQDYISKNTEDNDNTPHQARVHTGHHTLLRIVNDALDYEIDRLDKQMPLMVVK